jgi:hypothetical protein
LDSLSSDKIASKDHKQRDLDFIRYGNIIILGIRVIAELGSWLRAFRMLAQTPPLQSSDC